MLIMFGNGVFTQTKIQWPEVVDYADTWASDFAIEYLRFDETFLL